MILIFTAIVLLALIFKVYTKLTCGKCRCSKHLMGKVVIVTGANSGIGYETARDLAERGARVILGCRSEVRGMAARDKIRALSGNSDVLYRHLDLASLVSVRKFAKDILSSEMRLDILINNAGIFEADKLKTEDALPYVMQSNYFGHFLLTNLLLPLVKSSAPSRIINVSSSLYRMGEVDIQNIHKAKAAKVMFNKYKVYGDTKLCNILMTVELERQLRGTGVTVNCLDPGAVATNIMNKTTGSQFLNPISNLFAKTCWEGAQTTIYLAVSEQVRDVSGAYFSDCKQRSTSKLSQNKETAQKLWKVSEKIVKLI